MKKELCIRETQGISLEILRIIASICEKEGYRYTLIYGTLIGAVRHHGYIPWDDDVDIMMPRPDYEKFLLYMQAHIAEHPSLKLFNHETCKNYPYMITRISDDRYVIDMKNEKPFGMGVFVDIYPYDGLGKDKKSAIKYGMKGDHLSSLCYQSTRQRFAIETTTSIIKKIMKFPIYLFSKVIGKEFFQRKLQELANKYEYDDSNYVGCVIWLSWGEKDIFPREWFDETIYMQFEDIQLKVPKHYDEILRHEYGDYMVLPPEKDRVGHHYFKVYEK